MKKLFPLFILLSSFMSCSSKLALPTIDNVDINQYKGKWYEIARLPNSFEKGLSCVTAEYSIKTNGKIKVVNKGYAIEKSKWKSSQGTAWVPDNNFPGQLKVSFFWPFAGDYYIIALADDYSYALVGAPDRNYLWVLSRTKTLDVATYEQLIQIAKNQNFDTSNLEKINQTCTE